MKYWIRIYFVRLSVSVHSCLHVVCESRCVSVARTHVGTSLKPGEESAPAVQGHARRPVCGVTSDDPVKADLTSIPTVVGTAEAHKHVKGPSAVVPVDSMTCGRVRGEDLLTDY